MGAFIESSSPYSCLMAVIHLGCGNDIALREGDSSWKCEMASETTFYFHCDRQFRVLLGDAKWHLGLQSTSSLIDNLIVIPMSLVTYFCCLGSKSFASENI
ncbi:hypothetical protein AMTRI_Chr03g146770 [Amborella trichopoda]